MLTKTLTKITLEIAISSVIVTMASASASAATFTYNLFSLEILPLIMHKVRFLVGREQEVHQNLISQTKI